MAIYRLLENSAFAPERVRIMAEAYQCACRELELAGDHTDPLTQLVARKIVEIAQADVDLDATHVCHRSLQELGVAKH